MPTERSAVAIAVAAALAVAAVAVGAPGIVTPSGAGVLVGGTAGVPGAVDADPGQQIRPERRLGRLFRWRPAGPERIAGRVAGSGRRVAGGIRWCSVRRRLRILRGRRDVRGRADREPPGH